MGTGLISMLAVLAAMASELSYRFGGEIYANIVMEQDSGIVADAAPMRLAVADAAAETAVILPVLIAAPRDVQAEAVAPKIAAASVASNEKPTATPTPATVAKAATELAQPSPELLAMAGDTAMRRPDGSVFLPITLQRLIGLRTQITKLEDVTPSASIPGRVVTNRDVGSLVQARQGGIIEAAGTKLPALGTQVAKGQLLVTIRPVLDAMRRAEITAKIAEIENLILASSQRVARLYEVSFIRYRESKINAVNAEIEGYRRQLLIYRGMLDDVTEIRAHTNGVISRVGFVAGQFVEPQTTLFEIVDPSRLWVEATAFDTSLPGDIGEARAVTADGQTLALRFIGGGLSLQGQAVPLQFEILGGADGLQLGRAVTVVISRAHGQARGVRLPVSSIVQNAGGETVVWQRLGAESFVSRTVTATALDGASVLVTAGLSANMRIVTADTSILTQVR